MKMGLDSTENEIARLNAAKAAKRAQFNDAFSAAKHRFAPSNLRDEMVDRSIDAAIIAATKGKKLVSAHKGKVALGAAAAMAFFARRPLAKAAGKARDAWRQRGANTAAQENLDDS